MCGRGPSTYIQAAKCEESDFRQLDAFGLSLCRALLHIIAHSRKVRLPELVELLFAFAGTRFFIGEAVEFEIPNTT